MQVWACPLRMNLFSKRFSFFDYIFLDILISAYRQRFPHIVHFTLFLAQASILFYFGFLFFLISKFFIFTSVLSLPYGFQIVQNLAFLGFKFPSPFLLRGKEDSIAQWEKGRWKFDPWLFVLLITSNKKCKSIF
jgi:hypothetical protein